MTNSNSHHSDEPLRQFLTQLVGVPELSDQEIADQLDGCIPDVLPEDQVQRILQQTRARQRQQWLPVNRMPDANTAGNALVSAELLSQRPARVLPAAATHTRFLAVLAAVGCVCLAALTVDRSSTEVQQRNEAAAAQRMQDLTSDWLTARDLPARTAVTVAVGDRLQTADQERRRVSLPDGSVLMMNTNTRVHVAAERQLRVDQGEVYVEVQPLWNQGQRIPFDVATPQQTLRALGTRFAVNATAGQTDVLVTQGRVAVGTSGPVLTAGQRVSVESPSDAAVRPEMASRPDVALDWTRELLCAAGRILPDSEYAGGAIITVDPNGQETRLSLRRYHVDVHIEDGFARTTIDQTYFNHTSSRLEGTFRFPLPSDASLSRLAMYVNGKLMEGGMAERQHARNTFEKIVSSMKDPALLEWVDGSTFKMRVFPLEPRQEKRIVLSYTQRLTTRGSQSVYRFPAGHSMDVVRDWSTAIRVHQGQGCRWTCSSHELQATVDESDLLLNGEQSQSVLNRDLVLTLEDPDTTTSTRWSSTRMNDDQYLMLRCHPDLPENPVRKPRHWILLFEASADRDPLLARTQVEIFRTLLNNVEHSDTFQVLTANVTTDAAAPSAQCSAQHIAKAITHLEQTHLIGALDLEQAFRTAVRSTENAQRDVMLVHVGSAIPVLGETSPDKLLDILPEHISYVGVGVGKRWSRSLMKAAAARSGGYFTQINPDEDLPWRAFELWSALNTPRLLNVSVRAADSEPADHFLTFAETLVHGDELCAVTRLPGDAALPSSVTVSGELDGHPWQMKVPVRQVRPRAEYLPRTWTRLEIDRLLMKPSQRQRIVDLSCQMYVMSPYTSLLVLENDEMYARYNVDRGRKDHWALYPCPKQIPVVTEPRNTPRIPLTDSDRGNPSVLNTISQLPDTDAILRTTAPTSGTRRSALINSWQMRLGPPDDAFPTLNIPVRENIVPSQVFYPQPFLPQVQQFSVPIAVTGGRGGGHDGGRVSREKKVPDRSLNRSRGVPGGIGGNGRRQLEVSPRVTSGFGSRTESSEPGDSLQRLSRFDFSSNGMVTEFSSFTPRWSRSLQEALVETRDRGNVVSRESHLPEDMSVAQTVTDLSLVLTQQPTAPESEVLDISRTPSAVPLSWRSTNLQDQHADSITLSFSVSDLYAYGGQPPAHPRLLGAVPTTLSQDGVLFSRRKNLTQPPVISQPARVSGARTFAWQPHSHLDTSGVLPRLNGLPTPQLPQSRQMTFALCDLVRHAPGLYTSQADVLHVLETDANQQDSATPPGQVDPQAAQLIRAARRNTWEQVTLPAVRPESAWSLRCNGLGEFIWTRFVSDRLIEHASCDGNRILHSYPEIGLAAVREASRFHQQSLRELIPWLVPSTEDLSRDYHVRLVDAHTVALFPISDAATVSTKADSERNQLQLVFNDRNDLCEQRWLDAEGRVLHSVRFHRNGLVQCFGAEGKLTNEARWQRMSCRPPDRPAAADDLVQLPLPYRTPEYVNRQAESNPDEVSPMHKLAAHLAAGDGDEVISLIEQQFLQKGDRRPGWYVLLSRFPSQLIATRAVSGSEGRVMDTLQFPPAGTSDLMQFLQQWIHLQRNYSDHAQLKIGDSADGFVQRVATTRNLYAHWKSGNATRHRTDAQIDEDLDRVLRHLERCHSDELAWLVLSVVTKQLPQQRYAGRIAEAAERYQQHPMLQDIVRQERARALYRAGQSHQAEDLVQEFLLSRIDRRLPVYLDRDLRLHIQAAGDRSCWTSLIQTVNQRLLDSQQYQSALQWASHLMHHQEENAAEELIQQVLQRVSAHTNPDAVLLALQVLPQVDAGAASRLAGNVLQQPRLKSSPALWKFAADIADRTGQKRVAVQRLERSVQLAWEQRPDVIDLGPVRHRYNNLLNRYEQLIEASQTLQLDPPGELRARIIRAADQWRSLDDDDTTCCQTAARLLQKLNADDLAWAYLSTPLADRAGDASAWQTLAGQLTEQEIWSLADMAWQRAFQAERTNPQHLWQRSQLLEQRGEHDLCRQLLQQIVDGTWQPRFRGTVDEAVRALAQFEGGK